jgi:FkbH-like protein
MDALTDLLQRLRSVEDVNEQLEVAASLRALPAAVLEAVAPARGRLAVLTGYTSRFLSELVAAHALARGVRLETKETLYGLYEQAIFAKDPELVAFAPTVVYFCVGTEHLELASVEAEVVRWRRAWEAARALFDCDVILNTFVEPSPRVFGNAELKLEGSRGRKIAELNLALAREAPAYVHLHDVNALALDLGRATMFDPKWFALAKLPANLNCLPEYARSVSAVVAAVHGRSKKGIVLDLDGTLWGGVVGDDGVAGIRIGADSAEGESFRRFQTYLKELAERGVFLAVCSKNEEAIARAAFERPDMVLKLEHIGAFAASWGTKDQAILRIAADLNVLPESLVFVDDSPAERELVRQRLPQVAVVDLPNDPAGYPAALARGRFFETTYVSKEDALRVRSRSAERERSALEQQSASYDDYLASLGMEATIRPWTAEEVGRVGQLLAKTNQFNLTGERFSDAQLLARIDNPEYLSLCLHLSDRFGDHGLVSVLLARCAEPVSQLENWVMSCRVFSRGAEALFFGEAARELQSRGVRAVHGKLIPTERNGYVKELFPSLGFSRLPASAPGVEAWQFDLTAEQAVAKPSPIRLKVKGARVA